MRAVPRAARPVAVVAAVQAALVVPLALVVGTWNDEEYTLATTAHGLGYALGRAVTYELQAPLYFGLMALLRDIDPAVWFARAFSVACALGLTFAAAAVARRVAPARAPFWFAAAVAFNPFTVYAALEIRLYAFALLLSALLWLAFFDGFCRGEDRPRARTAFAVLAVAAAYVQYYLALELVAGAVALLVLGRRDALVRYARWLVPVAVALVPAVLLGLSQVGSAYERTGTAFAAVRTYGEHPWLDFVLPVDAVWAVGRNGGAVQRVVLALAVVGFVGARARPDRRAWAVVAFAAAIETMFVALAALGHVELISPRHFAVLVVPELAAAYALVCALPRRARAFAGTLGFVYALACVATLAARYHTGAKIGDWPRVGAYLTAQAAAADSIAVFQPDALPAFERYYRGAAPAVPFPDAMSSDRYDERRLAVQSEAQAVSVLDALTARGRRVWLVVSGCGKGSTDYGCDKLERAVAAFDVLRDVPFYENSVRLLVRRASPASGVRSAPARPPARRSSARRTRRATSSVPGA